MKHKKKLISIIVPCFNEEKNIQPFLLKIKSIINRIVQIIISIFVS